MNYVEPIKDMNKVHEMIERLSLLDQKYKVMFMLGVYTALRISDILQLKVKDVRNKQGITLREQKTKKQRIIEINSQLKKELNLYITDKLDEEYLIDSRQGVNVPITRQRAYQVLSQVGHQCGIENIGTHTMRKTFGYHYYLKTKDVAVLQKIFNHSTPQHTLRYIGIEQCTINDAIRSFRL